MEKFTREELAEIRMLTKEDIEYLRDGGVVAQTIMPSGCIIGVMRLMFTYALVSNLSLEDSSSFYHHRYCYEDLDLAIKAFTQWDGVSAPLPGYVAYKGSDMELLRLDEERKRKPFED